MKRMHILLAPLLLLCGCKSVGDFFFSSSTRVVSDDRDALYRAARAVLSRYGPIAGESLDKGYVRTREHKRTIRRQGLDKLPHTTYVTERMEARIYAKGKDGPYEVRVRVYEAQETPRRSLGDYASPAVVPNDARLATVNHASTSTRSTMRERMVLDQIARELALLQKFEPKAAEKPDNQAKEEKKTNRDRSK